MKRARQSSRDLVTEIFVVVMIVKVMDGCWWVSVKWVVYLYRNVMIFMIL